MPFFYKINPSFGIGSACIVAKSGVLLAHFEKKQTAKSINMERKTFFLSLTQRRHYTKHSSNNSTYLYHLKFIILQFYFRCRFVVHSLCIRSIYTLSITGEILSIYTKTRGIILKIQYNSPCFILAMSDYFLIISC